jgi:hypothetical protein
MGITLDFLGTKAQLAVVMVTLKKGMTSTHQVTQTEVSTMLPQVKELGVMSLMTIILVTFGLRLVGLRV